VNLSRGRYESSMGDSGGKSDKSKVLLIVRWPVGGIRTFIRYVYRNFDPAQWHFTIVAPDVEEMRVLVDDLAGLGVRFVPVEGMPNDGSSGFWKMFYRAAVELLKGNYDLVHSHGFTSGMCVAIPAFVWRTPHLMTSHDVINASQFAGPKGKLKKRVMGYLLSMIDTIQSVSYDAQENLLSNFPTLGRRKGKLIVIPNGIEVERFEKASPRDLRGELGLGEEVFLIGFLGRFMSQKGFRYLVDAIDILRQDVSLPKQPLVLTFGDGGFIREEKAAIKERGLERYFRFMPFAPNAAGTIKGLDVVAMPSLWEACGLLAMEAMAAGVPLIGTNCVGLREVLRNTPGKPIQPADSKALSEAILEEMKGPSKEIAKRFAGEAALRFDVKRRAEELETILRRLIWARLRKGSAPVPH
jgi:glycosyltransferase involved in cell wall biosynthesis